VTERPGVVWLVRCLWPFLGACWGAWLGAGGYFDIDFAGQGLAALLVGGYFVAFAVLGLVVGAIAGATAGGVSEFLLRRSGLGVAPALLAGSLACFLACFALSDAVQGRYPGIHAPSFTTAAPAAKKTAPMEITPPPRMANPCLDKPPIDRRLRKVWEDECR
jgi:hypothetical protein